MQNKHPEINCEKIIFELVDFIEASVDVNDPIQIVSLAAFIMKETVLEVVNRDLEKRISKN